MKRFLLVLHCAVATSAFAQSGAAAPPIETIITRMIQARDEDRTHLRPYRVTRDYKLVAGERQTTKAEVIADVRYAPPELEGFTIRLTSGAAMGEKIVRQMLEHEAASMTDDTSDISPANYTFHLLRQEQSGGRNCYVVKLTPKRKDKKLLRGTIWVDAATYRFARIEGEPAKAPSWWLRDVRIALVFGPVSGMWLQTASESSANVRLLGLFAMLSHDVDYKISELSAGASEKRVTVMPPIVTSTRLSGR